MSRSRKKVRSFVEWREREKKKYRTKSMENTRARIEFDTEQAATRRRCRRCNRSASFHIRRKYSFSLSPSVSLSLSLFRFYCHLTKLVSFYFVSTSRSIKHLIKWYCIVRIAHIHIIHTARPNRNDRHLSLLLFPSVSLSNVHYLIVVHCSHFVLCGVLFLRWDLSTAQRLEFSEQTLLYRKSLAPVVIGSEHTHTRKRSKFQKKFIFSMIGVVSHRWRSRPKCRPEPKMVHLKIHFRY